MDTSESLFETRSSRATFGGLLLVAMVAGTIAIVAIGVLSRFLIDDLGISRAEVGALVTAAAIAAAVASPPSGRLTDRIGGRKTLFVLFSLSTVGLLGLAVAPVYVLLLVAGVVAGVAQATANPATNKLIARYIAPGKRGLITGIKQSGVQAGLFLGGLLLPAGAIALGWRTTIALVALVPALALVVTRFVIPAEHEAYQPTEGEDGSRLPEAVWWLTGYSLMMGLGAGSLITFLPLYVQEEFGMTVTAAGLVVAVFGVTAMIVRIVSPPIAEAAGSFPGVLGSLSALAALAVLLLLIAPAAGNAVLWIGVILGGASATTWNSVAMLAVIDESGSSLAGRSSGIVVLGFLVGLGVGPLLFGYSVDTTGTYAVGLWAIVVLFISAAALGVLWLTRIRRLAVDHS